MEYVVCIINKSSINTSLMSAHSLCVCVCVAATCNESAIRLCNDKIPRLQSLKAGDSDVFTEFCM